MYKSPEEELDELEAEEEAAKPHLERMDLKLFEEEKVNKKIKDKEVKICNWKRRKICNSLRSFWIMNNSRIWNTDCKKYFQEEKIINEKISQF